MQLPGKPKEDIWSHAQGFPTHHTGYKVNKSGLQLEIIPYFDKYS